MNARELIESGIIEAYCLGTASAEEAALVNRLARIDNAVRDELGAVASALAKFATAYAVTPPAGMKQRILAEIDADTSVAPLLTSESTVQEWLHYLERIKVVAPEKHEGIHMVDLPGNDKQYTFVAWANPGDGIPEEVHDGENEYLFVCTGECEMTVEGKTTQYKSGDLITIEKGRIHSALTTGKERMQIVVQRRAA